MQTQYNAGFLLAQSNNEILRNLNKEPMLLGGNYDSLSLIIPNLHSHVEDIIDMPL